MKFVKLFKVVKVPLINIKQKMKAEGKYDPKFMDVRVKCIMIIVICNRERGSRLCDV